MPPILLRKEPIFHLAHSSNGLPSPVFLREKLLYESIIGHILSKTHDARFHPLLSHEIRRNGNLAPGSSDEKIAQALLERHGRDPIQLLIILNHSIKPPRLEIAYHGDPLYARIIRDFIIQFECGADFFPKGKDYMAHTTASMLPLEAGIPELRISFGNQTASGLSLLSSEGWHVLAAGIGDGVYQIVHNAAYAPLTSP